mmetsp:Transcript_13088/g.14538  ORF Transcript_13088/g.14538 Transcript_13088/m.14538 type:complete len:123 (-) Transcript_13088:162-530(-)
MVGFTFQECFVSTNVQVRLPHNCTATLAIGSQCNPVTDGGDGGGGGEVVFMSGDENDKQERKGKVQLESGLFFSDHKFLFFFPYGFGIDCLIGWMCVCGCGYVWMDVDVDVRGSWCWCFLFL